MLRARKKAKGNAGNPISLIVEKLDQLEKGDATDAQGVVFADKLRQLQPMQRIFAEKIISEVLFEGQLNNLTRYTTLTNLNDQLPIQVIDFDHSHQEQRLAQETTQIQSNASLQSTSRHNININNEKSLTSFINNFKPM